MKPRFFLSATCRPITTDCSAPITRLGVAPEKAVFRPALSRVLYAGASPERRMAKQKLTYSEQLRHPNWQRKRLEAFNHYGFECSNCGDKEQTLNVHHKRYVKGRMAWEYEIDDLAVLCGPCHAAEHEEREMLDRILADAGGSELERVIGLVSGFLYAEMSIMGYTAEEGRQHSPQYFELGIGASILGYHGHIKARQAMTAMADDKIRLNPVISAAIEQWESDK